MQPTCFVRSGSDSKSRFLSLRCNYLSHIAGRHGNFSSQTSQQVVTDEAVMYASLPEDLFDAGAKNLSFEEKVLQEWGPNNLDHVSRACQQIAVALRILHDAAFVLRRDSLLSDFWLELCRALRDAHLLFLGLSEKQRLDARMATPAILSE